MFSSLRRILVTLAVFCAFAACDPEHKTTDVECRSDCGARSCGDDGCGNSCGTCPSGFVCQQGTCRTCEPACAGRTCGSDGCGGSCGSCDSSHVCTNGACAARCVPSCTGKMCGPDGCGGTCGTCDSLHTCSNGQCVSNGQACGTSNGTTGCPDGIHVCPANATCNAASTACACNPGHQAETCAGQSCSTVSCTFPNWWCAPSATGPTCTSWLAHMSPVGLPAFDCSLPPGPLAIGIMSDINTHWSSAVRACPCNTDAYVFGGCGGNAFFLANSPGYIFYDPGELEKLTATAGGDPIAAAWVLGHETGHNVQTQFNMPSSAPIGRELGADCLAGYLLGWLQCTGRANAVDLQLSLAAVCSTADPIGIPWFDPRAHGTCNQRVGAVMHGIQSSVQGLVPTVACQF